MRLQYRSATWCVSMRVQQPLGVAWERSTIAGVEVSEPTGPHDGSFRSGCGVTSANLAFEWFSLRLPAAIITWLERSSTCKTNTASLDNRTNRGWLTFREMRNHALFSTETSLAVSVRLNCQHFDLLLQRLSQVKYRSAMLEYILPLFGEQWSMRF